MFYFSYPQYTRNHFPFASVIAYPKIGLKVFTVYDGVLILVTI